MKIYLVTKALHIDRVAQEIVVCEHVGKRGPRSIVHVGDVLEAGRSVFLTALATGLVAETPDYNTL